jgi:hypothetical protein
VHEFAQTLSDEQLVPFEDELKTAIAEEKARLADAQDPDSRMTPGTRRMVLRVNGSRASLLEDSILRDPANLARYAAFTILRDQQQQAEVMSAAELPAAPRP